MAARRPVRSGDLLRITRAASVQFTQPMLFRVIRVHDWQTLNGWTWLDGYQLNSVGDAVERRSIFVQLHGLQWAALAKKATAAPVKKATAAPATKAAPAKKAPNQKAPLPPMSASKPDPRRRPKIRGAEAGS